MGATAAIIAAAALSAGAGVYESQSAQSSQKSQANALANKKMPSFVPYDIGGIEKAALSQDQTAYALSNAAFAHQHPQLAQAQKLFQSSVLADQKGNSTLMPALQNQFLDAGLGNALGAFGSNGATLGQGSAGQADVAANLGMSILNMQQLQRQNSQGSLSLAESLFPHEQLGLTGQNVAQLMMQNTAGQNAFNQGQFSLNFQAGQQNQLIAANQAAQQNAMLANITNSLAQGAALNAGGSSSYGGTQGATGGINGMNLTNFNMDPTAGIPNASPSDIAAFNSAIPGT